MTFICWSFATVRIQLIFGHKIAGVLPAVEGNQGLTTSPCSNLHPDCSEHISDMTKSSHMLIINLLSPKTLTMVREIHRMTNLLSRFFSPGHGNFRGIRSAAESVVRKAKRTRNS